MRKIMKSLLLRATAIYYTSINATQLVTSYIRCRYKVQSLFDNVTCYLLLLIITIGNTHTHHRTHWDLKALITYLRSSSDDTFFVFLATT